MSRSTAAVLAVLLASLAVPAPAGASSVSLTFLSNEQTGAHQEERSDLYKLTYAADPGEANRVEITGYSASLRIADPGAVIRPGPFCQADGDGEAPPSSR
jgi:hypothetical protein